MSPSGSHYVGLSTLSAVTKDDSSTAAPVSGDDGHVVVVHDVNEDDGDDDAHQRDGPAPSSSRRRRLGRVPGAAAAGWFLDGFRRSRRDETAVSTLSSVTGAGFRDMVGPYRDPYYEAEDMDLDASWIDLDDVHYLEEGLGSAGGGPVEGGGGATGRGRERRRRQRHSFGGFTHRHHHHLFPFPHLAWQQRHYDLRAANMGTANSMLARELQGRHLQMIAIGGSIGTGLFVASGKALSTGGPASVLLAYAIVGSMLFCTVQALGELSVMFPVAGSFSAYSTRFLDPAWGFAMGWNYALQWLITLPLEIIAASITVGYWNPQLDRAIFVTIFLFVIVIINLFGVRGYGEAEFAFAIIKVAAVVGFILLGIVINIGGPPTSGYIGGRYWVDPGAFHNGFKGLCSVFVTAAFAFSGTELVGLAAAETANPRKSLPTAIKQVFWRITLFYIIALTLVGLLVPYDDPRLLEASSSAGASPLASASPFVIAIENAGIGVLPGLMNGVILVAVVSVGNSAVYGSTRTLAALASQGQAPRALGYVDRRGRPLVALAAAMLVALLAYLADLRRAETEVLGWLMAVSSLSSVLTWASICFAHVRFRAAWRARRRSLRELAFRARAGVAGSWFGLAMNALVLAALFWTAAWPMEAAAAAPEAGGGGPARRARDFFLQYMTVPIVAVFWGGHRWWYRGSGGTGIVGLGDIDLDTGRRDFNLPILVAQEMDEKMAWPAWKKVYRVLC